MVDGLGVWMGNRGYIYIYCMFTIFYISDPFLFFCHIKKKLFFSFVYYYTIFVDISY